MKSPQDLEQVVVYKTQVLVCSELRVKPNMVRVQGSTRAVGESNRVFTEKSASSLDDTGDFLFLLTSAPSACAGQQSPPIQTRGRHWIRPCLISLHGKVQGKETFWMDLLLGSASKSHFSMSVSSHHLPQVLAWHCDDATVGAHSERLKAIPVHCLGRKMYRTSGFTSQFFLVFQPRGVWFPFKQRLQVILTEPHFYFILFFFYYF